MRRRKYHRSVTKRSQNRAFFLAAMRNLLMAAQSIHERSSYALAHHLK